MIGWLIVAALLVALAAYGMASGFFKALFRYRGTRVIVCPENHQPAAVTVDMLHAAQTTAVTGEPDLRLRSCSRWPEMQGCGQGCLSQIEATPEQCLVKTIVASWYAGKKCVFCGREIGPIVWHERPPALRAPDGSTREWKEIAPEKLPDVFATHAPACWQCHIVEWMRREHPDLIVERRVPLEPEERLQPTANVY